MQGVQKKVELRLWLTWGFPRPQNTEDIARFSSETDICFTFQKIITKCKYNVNEMYQKNNNYF